MLPSDAAFVPSCALTAPLPLLSLLLDAAEAMGNATSDGSGGDGGGGGGSQQGPFDSIPSRERHGWKILSVSANSPSSGLGLCPYFSVITHVGGERLGTEEAGLVPLIREGVATALTVLNLATLSSRVVTVTPRRGWGGEGLLGLLIVHSWFDNAALEAIHVLEVHHGSPAEQAGLRAHSDFLLGTSRIAFKSYQQVRSRSLITKASAQRDKKQSAEERSLRVRPLIVRAVAFACVCVRGFA